MTLLFEFLIGLFAGLRSPTPPAAVAWAVHLGWLNLARPLSLVGSLPAVIILSLLAITEVILDKLPNTPNRTAPSDLFPHIVTGGFTGACVSLGSGQSAFVGAGLGLIGGIVGCFAGCQDRARLVRSLRLPDFQRCFARGPGCDRWQSVHRFAILVRRIGNYIRPGFGGRVTFNLTESIAFEAEGNYYTREQFSFPEGGQMFQGQFGGKIGKRFDRWGVFGKTRPGLVGFSRVLQNPLAYSSHRFLL